MSRIKIEKVNNGYIVTFHTVIGGMNPGVIEVYGKFEDVIKEIKKYFCED